MLYEKKKILIHRLIWTILLVIGIIIHIILLSPTDVEIIDDNGYIESYYEYLDETHCKIEVTFNKNVSYGYVTISFYDENNKLLTTKEEYFYGYNNTLSSSFFIDGKVNSYQIISYRDIHLDFNYPLFLILIFTDIFITVFFICSFLLSYKTYNYKNKTIIIYAGFYHHYIKINETKYDEHNTIVTHTAIHLSCNLDDKTVLDATITTSNRISLKINNKLVQTEKK